jgi:hypothetical protein
MICFRISRLKRSWGLQTRKTSEPEGSHYENLKLFTIHLSKLDVLGVPLTVSKVKGRPDNHIRGTSCSGVSKAFYKEKAFCSKTKRN